MKNERLIPVSGGAKDIKAGDRANIEDILDRHTPREIMLATSLARGLYGDIHMQPIVKALLGREGEYVPVTERRVEQIAVAEMPAYLADKGVTMPEEGVVMHNDRKEIVWASPVARQMAQDELRQSNPQLYKLVADKQVEAAENWIMELAFGYNYLANGSFPQGECENRWRAVFGHTREEYAGKMGRAEVAADPAKRKEIAARLAEDLIRPGQDGAANDVHEHNRERFAEAVSWYEEAKGLAARA